MPADKSRYPPNWDSIALSIKEAAEWICGDCGRQCYRPGEKHADRRRTMSVHHIDHDPPNVDPSNLIALCARCHLIRDAPHHAQNAARTRRAKRIATGQAELELEV